jgi:hypothetical protein
MQRGQGKIAVTVAAAAFTLGLAAFTVSDQAEARKGFTGAASGTYTVSPTGRGGVSTLPATGKAKANPSPIVRDHRGEPERWGRRWCHGSRFCPHPGAVRDHRRPRPRVVPKEDPPQKW